MRRHHDPSNPDDVVPRRNDPRGDDFWGDTADWPTNEIPAVTPSVPTDRFLDDAEPTRAVAAHGDEYAGLADDVDDELLADSRWDDGWADDEPRRPARVDPLVLRIAAVAVAATLAVPLLLGLRSDSTDPDSIETVAAVPATTVAGGDQASTSAPAAETPVASTDDADAPSATGAGTDAADGAEEPTAACGADYDVAEGDFWIRIAEGADVELAELLAVNDATVDSALYPGTSICLPVGASTPPPPPEPEVAAADTSETALSSSASATAAAEPVPNPRQPPAAPPTTAAPTTTTAPPPPPPPSSGDPVAIIRSVWPDELEERAITIAWRESNHRPDVYNGICCYGLFQIYYDVHRSWLASDLGITSAQQLFDPLLNAQAAYRLYERAGGWGPWSQTNY